MRRLLALVLLCIFFTACKQDSKTLFRKIEKSASGIDFVNAVLENDSVNVLDVENIYNGGGVAIADFNNDGMQDIYYIGNMSSNKLYLNKGNFKFNDVTTTAGVSGDGRWGRGASAVDINNDGLMDIYVSATLSPDPKKRENILYINKGNDKSGTPVFVNMAPEYKLNDTSHSTMAAFFDYDNDGDLDMYLLVNQILKKEYPNQFRPIFTNGEFPSTGKLFRCDYDSLANHPVYTNVSKEAGITIEGYGHGVNIADINMDGWKDIYVTNDFLANNILYINNGNGTFTDKVKTYFKHTSSNAMGQDIQDINNDGLPDIIELDMNPEDNYRKKMMMPGNKYQAFQNSEIYGYQYQYIRNSLQLNMGPRLLENDSIGDPVFADIGFYSGISETDWSWDPLIGDFDNDGHRDVIITNGFPKDVTDQDFIVFRNKANLLSSKKEMLEQVPVVKIPNYAYRNNGKLQFTNVSAEWGLNQPSFSNGAAYADLDNDGDLDCIINNINEEAFLYENTLKNTDSSANYLRVKFAGSKFNVNGIGATAHIYYNGLHQVYDNTPYRGYLSSLPANAHFGLGTAKSIDSITIIWPGNTKQVLKNVKANQTITVNEKEALHFSAVPEAFNTNSLFADHTQKAGIKYQHQEQDFIDFNIQKLLPHKLSEYGPAIAVGDVNGDGKDDMVAGGSAGNSAEIFLQTNSGGFVQKKLLPNADYSKLDEDMGILLFDADGDGDMDLYISSGSNEQAPGSASYQDKFYINDGKGNFRRDTTSFPPNTGSKSCVRAADFDRDGDLDLMVTERAEPWNFPKPVSSHLYRNDSKGTKTVFTDVTKELAPELLNLGLVCDAVWTDYNNDGWADLIMAGEFMPITIFKNEKGRFKNISSEMGIGTITGWWNSVVPGDFDNDGDMDYVLGNLGLNSFYKADPLHPVRMYAKDFDRNGTLDAVPSLYLHPVIGDTSWKEFPAHNREDMVKQMIMFRAKFQNFNSYARAAFPQFFTADEMKDAWVLKADYFSHVLLKNEGNGKFSLVPLPAVAQFSAVNGMVADDFDGDGKLDLALNTNDYSTEVIVGRYDAGNGLVLKGDGKGGFQPQSILQSGLFIPGNGKAMARLLTGENRYSLVATQNRSTLKLFTLRKPVQAFPVSSADFSVILYMKNGRKQKIELNYGSSFLSQSGRYILISNEVDSFDITDYQGNTRKAAVPHF